MQDDIIKKKGERNPNGTMKKGSSANPSGSNGTGDGWQRTRTRYNHFLDKLTLLELKELRSSPEKLDKYTLRDALIIDQLTDAFVGRNKCKEKQNVMLNTNGKMVELVEVKDTTIKTVNADMSGKTAAQATNVYAELMKQGKNGN